VEAIADEALLIRIKERKNLCGGSINTGLLRRFIVDSMIDHFGKK
jgi:hypothetical protein